jgi:hypothetical protein
MIIEYSQLMSTAHRMIDGTEYNDLSINGRRIKRWRHPEYDAESNESISCSIIHQMFGYVKVIQNYAMVLSYVLVSNVKRIYISLW